MNQNTDFQPEEKIMTATTTPMSAQHDQTLLNKILERIRWDIRISASDVLIKVKNGVVILNGYFDQSYRKTAAISVIATTEGVHDLIDHSQVLSDYHRDDRDLIKLIRKQIQTLSLMRGEWINVNVHDGVAKLEGCVFRPRLKAFAARATWELSGVKDCLNLVMIRELPGSFPAFQSDERLANASF